MRGQISSIAAVLVLATTTMARSSVKTKTDEGGRHKSPEFNDGADDSEGSCGLYLATSSTSLPGDHKWGVYTGKDIPINSPIGFGDVAIHTFHLMANNIWMDPETDEIVDNLDVNQYANVVDWFEQFVWVPHSSGGQFEIEDTVYGAKVVTAIPGTGVLGGYNPKLTNADWNHSSAYHREALNEYPGEAHPGRGAYSNYYNLELSSTELIQAGKEIFLQFGDNWEKEVGNEETEEQLTPQDFEKVDQTVEKMVQFFEKHDSKLDDVSKQRIYNFLRDDVMVAAAGKPKGRQIKNLLPEDPSDLKEILADGGSFASKTPGESGSLEWRSLEWLETNGLCMDNIKPGPSTIPYAGRGAFANRDIKEGTLVAPVPLVQIPDEAILNMYPVDAVIYNSEDVEENSAEPDYMWLRESEDQVGIQLLMNYMYGHPESSMLFFPVGAVASYINHAPSNDKINAKMEWSKHPENQLDWLDEELQAFNAMGRLVIEIVATKDIKEGEEVFIDYGKEWQDAWDRHVEEWNENKEDSWPIRALDLNQEHRTKPFRTIEEEPYPEEVMMKCFLMVTKPDGEIHMDSLGRKVRIWSDSESGKSNIVSNNLFDCEIETHEETPTGHSYNILWNSGKSITVVTGVPHRAIVFLDQPEVGDQHIWNSFRHYISMGDIFPDLWKEIVSSDDEVEETHAYNEEGEL
uniref:SET domain-containing protein n=1 Tax=Pseudo-nitzschia australis TaxID=44445 RepID=A0A7S4AHG7_9STRA|mmetsp:Transcript_25394/g.55651  ORF Transcript_25394/g.55651 Transcript_25394/m.55651 type:complete len:688 (+) Transcript_25394:154-2217(+)